ncbi:MULTISPECIES: DUF4012 domain-containing protein [Nocardioides]|uniref:DUF4012 domain-containing protein n=1 Tax=Nocardioides vastitatis TaxID=2568655 RepID=A0ABW0ZAY0_9ACTN|nr:DUF4012 domain-containing protein [Nocardioides sp.]THJ02329.1 DUF4012 domain-containing protein [Nocardioides sp.]
MSPEVRRRRVRGWRKVRRRLRRLLRGRRGSLVLPGVGGAIVLGLLWSAWLGWSTSRDLGDAADQVEIMQAALVRGDADGARNALAAYREAAESAESRTSGPTWSVFGKVPVLGDDAEGVAIVSAVLADIGRDGLPPVVDAAELVTAETFQPTDKRFPVRRIAGMEGPARRSEAAFDAAAQSLGNVDSSGFLAPVREQFDRLRTSVTDARSTLGSTYRAARLIPRMMGTDRPRYYLMVLQNNAELRSGGGLPGALSLIEMRNGHVDIVEQADMSDIANDTDPTVELTKEERRVFGEILDRAAVDATLTPDFARAAEIIRARWERAVGGRLDGMFFIDPVAVSYLMRSIGPVPVPGHTPVDANNVVAAVENEVYQASSDREVQSNYQQAVSKAVFDVFADGAGDTAESIRGLVAGVMEGRIRMRSFDKAEQAEIAGTEIAGDFPRKAGAEPQVGIYLNDGGPTKMQYYLTYDAAVFARSCIGGRQDVAGSIDLHNDTPADVDTLPPSITGEGYPGVRVEPGDQFLILYLTSPIGGEITEIVIDGQRVASPVVEPFANRSLARVGIYLEPQSRHRVEFTMRSGRGQQGDVDLNVTPGAFPSSSNGKARSACTAH